MIFGTARSSAFNRISDEASAYLNALYRTILKTFGKEIEVELVCHCIDELAEARREFPDLVTHYHYDAKEYFDIYRSFDLVIGHRVHGLGLAASLAVPGILIQHDQRGDTARGFQAKVFSLQTPGEAILDEISALHDRLEDESRLLLEHKRKTWRDYVSLVKQRAEVLESPRGR